MHDSRFRLGVRIALSQADDSLVGVNAHPEIINRPDVNRDSAGQVDGFDSSDFHDEKRLARPRIIANALYIVNIIVDNIPMRDVECALPQIIGLQRFGCYCDGAENRFASAQTFSQDLKSHAGKYLCLRN
jgi:hypothetical protein